MREIASAAVASISEKVNISGMGASVSYSDTVATIALIVSTIAVPASGFISYYFAKRGDKRKEWNAIAEPFIQFFLERQGELNSGFIDFRAQYPTEQLMALRRRMSKRMERRLGKCYRSYSQIVGAIFRGELPSGNEPEKIEELKCHVSEILKLVRLKS